MFYLIGLGLVDDDVTIKGIEAMKKCDKIFCELYTNNWMGSLKLLEKRIGKKIVIMSRERAESDFLVKAAKKNDVALLVSGDPLTATTHFEHVFEAKKQGIKYEIIHAPSIYTSIAETGLSLYKFGRATSLTFPQKNFNPTSPYDIIEKNKSMDMHTLVLLDIKDKRQMSAKEGLELLLKLEEYTKKKAISKNSTVIACCRLGGKERVIKCGKVINLMKDKSLDAAPAVIIVPGKLNFKEEEALKLWM